LSVANRRSISLADALDPIDEPTTDIQASMMERASERSQTFQSKIVSGFLTEEEAARPEISLLVTARREEIIDCWQKAGSNFVAIGHALLHLRSKVSFPTWERLLRSYDQSVEAGDASEAAFPFGERTARRLMAVAEMIRQERFQRAFASAGRTFSETMLPPYSVACEFEPLSDEQLAVAVRQDLVNSTVPRQKVVAFVKSVRAPDKAPNPIAQSRALEAVNRKIARLLAQLRPLEQERAEIIKSMGGGLLVQGMIGGGDGGMIEGSVISSSINPEEPPASDTTGTGAV
jgi:hypothetical protein